MEQFLAASTADRLRMIRDGQHEKALRGFLGPTAYAEYEKLLPRLDEAHLAVATPPNLVFVPGVMGSLLQSETKGGVWWIDVRTRRHLNDLRLSADGARDRNADDQIAPSNVDTSYEPFLTQALAHEEVGHRTFPYDWRKSLTASASRLVDLIERLHAENGGRRLNLVGHSMGGLMIRAALMQSGPRVWPKIERILFIGTPHYGSPAIAGYLKNHLWGFDLLALLGLYLERATFRSLWGVLAMLPAPAGLYPGTRASDDGRFGEVNEYNHPCANFDLYSAAAWKLELNPADEQRLQRVLDGARDFHMRMADAHARLTQEQLDRMRVIAGVGYKTLFRLEFERRFWGIWERAKKITDRIERDPHREGDGRVPLPSARLDNVEVHYVRGVHGGLPNIPAVYQATFEFLKGNDLPLPKTPAEALSAHLAADEISDAPTLDGSGRARAADDPGVWELEADDERIAALAAELEQERLPDFNHVRLL